MIHKSVIAAEPVSLNHEHQQSGHKHVDIKHNAVHWLKAASSHSDATEVMTQENILNTHIWLKIINFAPLHAGYFYYTVVES